MSFHVETDTLLFRFTFRETRGDGGARLRYIEFTFGGRRRYNIAFVLVAPQDEIYKSISAEVFGIPKKLSNKDSDI